MEQTKLPSLAELHHDPQSAFKNDQLNMLLNQPPHASWLKKFPSAMKIEGEYLPIDKVDFMLKRIFGRTRIEVKSVQLILNSIQITIRLHYVDPITGEWEYQDGVGATPLQVDSGQPAANITALKSRAVQIATPIAKSAAKKDAAEELGALFGRDLNRKDTVMFSGGYSEQQPTQPQQPTPKQAAPAAPKPTPAPVFKDDNPYAATNGHTTNNQSSSFNLSAL